LGGSGSTALADLLEIEEVVREVKRWVVMKSWGRRCSGIYNSFRPLALHSTLRYSILFDTNSKLLVLSCSFCSRSSQTRALEFPRVLARNNLNKLWRLRFKVSVLQGKFR